MFEDLTTIEWIIAGAGALLLFLGLTKSGKDKKTGRTFLILGGIGIAVVFLLPLLGYDLFPSEGLAITRGGAPPNVLPGATSCAEDTTVTLSSQDAYTSTASGGRHRYRINGVPSLTVADGGTFTASPGDRLQVLWMENNSVDGIFSVLTNEVIPCAGTKTFTVNTYRNGTISLDIFNQEGNLIDNSTSENETLGAGDLVTLSARVRGTYQRGVPYGGIIVAEYDTTFYDDVILQFGGSSVAVPTAYAPIKSNNRTIAYEIPALFSNDVVTGSIVLDVGSTDPVATTTYPGIFLTFMPNNYFTNEDTGGSFDGPAVEDEDNTQTLREQQEFYLGVD
jgi:hypothetical protein